MRTLIVESDAELGKLWADHLARQGGVPTLVQTEEDAINALRFGAFEVLVVDLMLPESSALAICDFASYRLPDISIVVVTASSFFSDGSIFELIPNARGFLHTPVLPDDLAAMVEYYGRDKASGDGSMP